MNNNNKSFYFILKEEDNKGVFVCTPELYLVENNINIESVKFSKMEDGKILLLDKEENEILYLDIDEEHQDILFYFVNKKEAALSIMSLEGKPLLLIDIL